MINKNHTSIFLETYPPPCLVLSAGNGASRPREIFYLLFGVLPNFTDLVKVSAYLEDCLVLLILN